MAYTSYQEKVAKHLIKSGILINHDNRSNTYVGVDTYHVEKAGHIYSIVYVDGILAELSMCK